MLKSASSFKVKVIGISKLKTSVGNGIPFIEYSVPATVVEI